MSPKEVWLEACFPNMEMGVRLTMHSKEEVGAADVSRVSLSSK